jgi:hypothetical protein
MFAKAFRGWAVTGTAATVGMLAGGVASAEPLFFDQNGYQDEMHRCIDLLRPALQSVETGKVIYDVQDIELRGPWYQFEISVTVEDAAGNKRLDGYKVGCQSNRWVEIARLEDRRNAQKLPVEVKIELLASQ